MKTNLLKVAFVAAIALVGGVNVFNVKKAEILSDATLANIEALAQAESGDEYTGWSCCEAVWEKVSCAGCDGRTHSYAKRV